MTAAAAGPGFTHRPALDGLRAFAVLGVIAFHLGYPWATGGFLGVDMFFVLSGFLITSLLLTEHARTGRIDLVAFWTRRARRLLPAMGLVGAAILVAVPFTLSGGDELDMVRGDGIATVLYVANWHFAAVGEAPFYQFGDPSPMRHLWSLAVEEQFYLVWPLLLAGLLAYAARRRATPSLRPVILICAAGIVASAVALRLAYEPGGDPSRAYFGTDTRVHELLAGVLLAAVLHRRRARGDIPGPRARLAARLLAPVAVLALAVECARLDTHEPAYYRGGSLAATATVVLLLVCTEWGPERGLLNRVLCLRPVRYVGRLSYGLYLWHWPLLVWTSGGVYQPAGALRDVLRVGLMLAVAAASYHLVEAPLRRGLRRRRAPQRMFVPLRPATQVPFHLR